MFAKAFIYASLASLASAHMIMSNPKPYGNPTNAPLDASGSDFPCKGLTNDGSSDNVYKQGSTQELSFTGQAVHGGGSCQISLTTDKNPTKNSVWKVIKSIEGGCPSRTATGNLGDNAAAPNPDKYDFTIPKELAAGDYTLAWTWFNHVGNREMYMNCAAVKIEGSGGSKDFLSGLPDMFVANIGNNCATQNDADLQFPNPGKDVSRLKSKLSGPDPEKSSGCQKPVSGGGSGGDESQPSSPAAAPTSNNGAQPTQPATTPAPGAGSGSGSGSGDGSNGAPSLPGGGGAFITQPAAPQPTQPTATQAPAAPQTPEAGSGSGSGSGNKGGDSRSGSGSGGFAAGTACTNEGEWNCIGGSTFQRCASGAWTAAQQLSSGVSCTPGQAADIAMNVKRGNKFMRRALRIRA
ncbi:hypothetical protein F53441_6981 [Fusarium austroafricanum]|uniref:Chitin-binding type-4 domain-containing protein n=1 Tax=Fusarium austroafricanum TaxID=2364996 RepID=A0A8H4KHA5_9HYPO|nr:hypothetical protein F53441_6981 [Fusarium austroafricanum]